MAEKKLNLKCDVCGTRIVVTTSGESRLEPIYCCGLRVIEARGRGTAERTKAKAAAKKKAASRAKGGAGKKAGAAPARKSPRRR